MALTIIFVYCLIQYLIARFGEQNTPIANRIKSSATTYSLSLAVFCTSWTYYGNIGQASSQGIQHIALFIGSTLTYVLMAPLFKMMVRIKTAYHSTSIADFISTRYFNSQYLAALITILCLVGIVPYISIQLKSIIGTFEFVTNTSTATHSAFISLLDLLVVVLMVLFTIFFGARKLDPTERHPGIVVALASESLLKLLVFIIAGAVIIFSVFDGLPSIVSQLNEQQKDIFQTPPTQTAWFTSMLLGAIGVIALPRQFHIGVVECSNEAVIDKAKWMFPLYLFLINIMVLPIAMAGAVFIPNNSTPDLTFLAIPMRENMHITAAMVFIGGFAASTGMIMVSALTLSTMATNHLSLPLIETFPKLQFMRRFLLYLRWFFVCLILLLSLLYLRVIEESELLVQIGSISFVAMAQLVPALIGGLIWKRANLAGALSGIVTGSLLWFYTLMLPSIVRSEWLSNSLLEYGPFSIEWLKPEQLLGLPFSSNISHSLFWSLLVNVACFIIVSELFQTRSKEQKNHARKFLGVAFGKQKINLTSSKIQDNIDLDKKIVMLVRLVSRYVETSSAEQKVRQCSLHCKIAGKERVNVLELLKLKNSVTNMLAGLVGMATANKAMKAIELFTDSEQKELSNSYYGLIAKSQMSPEELINKVNFYQEKQELLEDHALHQERSITQLKEEQQATHKAKTALKDLNENLEQRVVERTEQLTKANEELEQAMNELKDTQKKLVEADKMASLGGLVAGVAHEINTPIGVVLTAISTLQTERDEFEKLYQAHKVSNKDMKQLLSNIEEVSALSLSNISRAAKLIESFKMVAVDQSTEEKREIDVKQYLEHIKTSLKPKLVQTEHQLIINCEANIHITSYPGAISQVLSNFILSSLIHAFPLVEKGTMTIDVTVNDQQLGLTYRDNGKGLTDSGYDKFFEPFYTTNRSKGGSGLGTHIAYNLVTQVLQGEIYLVKQKNGIKIEMTIPDLYSDSLESALL